jgi:hypothetical protein
VAEPRPPLVSDPDGGASPGLMQFFDFSQGIGNHQFAITYGIDANNILFAGYDSAGSTPLLASLQAPAGNYSRQLFEARPISSTPPAMMDVFHFKNSVPLGKTTTRASTIVDRGSNLIGRSNLAGQPGNPDFRGALCEIVIYSRDLLANEQQQVESYLMARWRLP